MTANTIGATGLAYSRLPARLASLQELTKIGSGRTGSEGFSQELLTEAEALLRRSGERMRMSASHTVVALAGGTGSGKSSLFNALAGANFSPAGVTRPTTKHSHACVWGMEGAAPLLDWLGVQRRHRYARASALDEGEASLVLACHPDEIDWFAENNFLPTLPRVRQEGLARPGRDGLLVLAASEGMPRGIALLDTPDIDSVVQAHHEFAYQFLDASDLWLFMTSASRYADGPVWEILQHARDRKASLGVVMSRIPQAYRTELVDHFNAMLDANGIAAADRFVIPEIPLIDGMLPPDAYQPIRDWLADTAARADRRVAVLSQNDVRCARHVQDQDPGRGRARRGAGRAARRTAAGRRDCVRERLR